MGEPITKSPAAITVKFAGWDAMYVDMSRDTELGGEPGNIFVIPKISPKFYFGART